MPYAWRLPNGSSVRLMPILRFLPLDQRPMTIALLLALAGSLVAMTVIVRRLEQR